MRMLIDGYLLRDGLFYHTLTTVQEMLTVLNIPTALTAPRYYPHTRARVGEISAHLEGHRRAATAREWHRCLFPAC